MTDYHCALATWSDDRFKTRDLRIRNFVELTQVLAETFATKPRTEWMALLEANDVPFAPVHNISEVTDDRQVRHLETLRTLRHPTEGRITALRRPVRIDQERDGSDLAAPTLGEHTDMVLKQLGYDDADIAKMRSSKVI